MLEISNINVSFRSERQEKLFGTTRDQVLFDVSLKVPQGTCLGILGRIRKWKVHPGPRDLRPVKT